MIQTSFNAISSGATGMFGGQVVRYIRNGREIIAKAPRKRPGKGTPGQERTRADFSKAAGWSAEVRADNGLRSYYQPAVNNGKNIHNLAIADYLVAPEVHDAFVVNGQIVIHATDNFRVAAVKVMIYEANGDLLEAGLAGRGEDDRWMYRPGKLPAGCSIVIVASDLPGNEYRYELTVPPTGPAVVFRTKVRVTERPSLVLHRSPANTG